MTLDMTRAGRCYELSAKHVTAHHGSVLVHGTIQGYDNPRIGHAWVITPEGNVWEPFSQQEFEPDLFRDLFNARDEVMYDWEATLLQTLRSGHWGPWEDEE